MGNLCDRESETMNPEHVSNAAAINTNDKNKSFLSKSTELNNTSQVFHKSAISQLCVNCGQYLYSGCKDNSVLLFDFTNKVLISSNQEHASEVTKVAASLNDTGLIFLSGSRDKSICLMSSDNLKELTKQYDIQDAHDFVISGLDFDPTNSSFCVSGSRDNNIKIWDLPTKTCIRSQSISRNLVTHIKWSKTAACFVQSSEDKEMRIWDSRSLKVVISFPRKEYIQTWCDINSDSGLCVSSSNGFTGKGCEATVWDIRQQKVLVELFGHQQSVNSVCFCGSNSSMVCTGSADRSVRLWDVHSGQQIAEHWLDGSGPITSVCEISDNLIAVGTFQAGAFVFQYDRDSNSLTPIYNY